MTAPKPVLIDTDPGLDDALALVLAIRSPALDVRAITVVAGNVSLRTCSENVLRILGVLQLAAVPPVFEGCAGPLSPRVARAEHVHGGDGLGGASSKYPVKGLSLRTGHAADQMVSMARRHGSDLSIITLGPLTNLAAALERDARAMARVREVIVMGGSLDGRGNVTPTAEFNFYADPLAAQAVIRSGLPVTVVGLNVTERARLGRKRFERCRAAMPRGELGSFLGDIAGPYFDFCRKAGGGDSCALHDPLAVAVAIDPGLVSTAGATCDVVTSQGPTRGTVVTDSHGGAGSAVTGAVDIDVERFLDLFLKTVCAP